MSGSFLLDTNIVIGLLAGEPAIQIHFEGDVSAFIPAIVIGELYYGAFASGRRDENIKRIDELVRGANVLDCDAGTGRYYGEVKARLRQRGRLIPENDVWIAALALQNGLTLASRDSHFDEVDNVMRESW